MHKESAHSCYKIRVFLENFSPTTAINFPGVLTVSYLKPTKENGVEMRRNSVKNKMKTTKHRWL